MYKSKSAFLVAGITLIAAIACQVPPPAIQDYAAELSKPTDTFIEVWNTGDYDKLDAVMSADLKRRAPDQDADGLAAMKDFVRQVRTTYPDFHIVVDESHYQKDIAFILWTVTGTNTGEGDFPPTGKSIEVSGMTMLRFANGKITHEIVQYDTATLTGQLGITAVPHAGRK